MIKASTTVRPQNDQVGTEFKGLFDDFIVWDAGEDKSFEMSKITHMGAAEFLHQLFSALLDLFLQLVKRDMRNVKATQINGLIDNMHNNQFTVELTCQG